MSVDARVQAAIETLQSTMDHIGWKPEQLDHEAIFDVDFGPPHLPLSNAVAAIVLPQEVFVIYFNFGVAADEERFPEVTQFITLANEELIVGAFVLDYDNGHVRFRSSVPFLDAELPAKLIENAIREAMQAIEKYAEALVDVVARGGDPFDAYNALQPD